MRRYGHSEGREPHAFSRPCEREGISSKRWLSTQGSLGCISMSSQAKA